MWSVLWAARAKHDCRTYCICQHTHFQCLLMSAHLTSSAMLVHFRFKTRSWHSSQGLQAVSFVMYENTVREIFICTYSTYSFMSEPVFNTRTKWQFLSVYSCWQNYFWCQPDLMRKGKYFMRWWLCMNFHTKMEKGKHESLPLNPKLSGA